MKFIHLSDLHIGKRVNEYSMIEDQKYILAQILDIIDRRHADAVIIAGDVYDKSIPPAEAVDVFDDFLVKLAKRNLYVFIISGNHDSPERIAFGARLMTDKRVYISPVYNGTIGPVTVSDENGNINIYMLPFIKPANVRSFYPEAEITSYTDTVKTAVDNMNIDTSQRNILITHQFVTGADRTESEDISVGGTDNVDVSVFDGFDYAALGHIHRAQKCSRETVRYSGTPLKYSFSEANDTKSVTIVDLGEKGSVSLDFDALTPLRDMKEIKGTYSELMARDYYEGTSYQTDYMHITLTDENDIPDAVGRLRAVYKNLMRLDYDNARTKSSPQLNADFDARAKSALQLFSEFYELQNNKKLSTEQHSLVQDMIEEIWEGEK